MCTQLYLRGLEHHDRAKLPLHIDLSPLNCCMLISSPSPLCTLALTCVHSEYLKLACSSPICLACHICHLSRVWPLCRCVRCVRIINSHIATDSFLIKLFSKLTLTLCESMIDSLNVRRDAMHESIWISHQKCKLALF